MEKKIKMQIIAVISENEIDFVKSILGKETTLSKEGGILVNDFLYKPITHKLQLIGMKFNGIIITKKAQEHGELRALFNETFKYIRI